MKKTNRLLAVLLVISVGVILVQFRLLNQQKNSSVTSRVEAHDAPPLPLAQKPDASRPSPDTTSPGATNAVPEKILPPTLQAQPLSWDDHLRGRAKIDVWFVNSVPTVEALRTAVTVAPPVADLSFEQKSWNQNSFTVSGAFTPGATYIITYGDDAKYKVVIPKLSPMVGFDAPGRYFTPSGKSLLPVQSVGFTSITVRAEQLLPQNIVFSAQNDNKNYWWRESSVDDLTAAVTQQVFRVTQQGTGGVDRTYFSLHTLGLARGVYMLNVTARDGKVEREDYHVVAVSDIGLSMVKRADGVCSVLALSLSGAQPLPGLRVALYAKNNTLLANGVTDERGIAQLKCGVAPPSASTEKSPSETQPFVLSALGKINGVEDATFLILSHRNEVDLPHLADGEFLGASGQEAYLFTERGIYRPGETLFVQGLLRGRDGNPPNGTFPLELRLRSPAWSIVRKVTVTCGEGGAFAHEMALPEDVRLGRYTIEVSAPGSETVLGSTSFRYESFAPPTIRVDFREPVQEGEAQSFVLPLHAEFLFGAPAGLLSGCAKFNLTDIPFVPKGYANYTFGDSEKPATESMKMDEVSFSLNESGDCRLLIKRPECSYRAGVRMHVNAEVFEPGGRTAAQYTSLDFFDYATYLGLKTFPGFIPVGKPYPLDVVAYTRKTESAAAPGFPCAYTLNRITYTCVRREESGRGWQWVYTKQVSPVKLPVADGKLAALPPLNEGEYVLTVAGGEDVASVSVAFNVSESGRNFCDYDRSAPEKITLTPNQKTYAPGDTLTLSLSIPFTNTTTLSVLVQNDSVLTQHIAQATGSRMEVAFPVTDAWAPGVDILVTAIHPARKEGDPGAHRAVGRATFPVIPGTAALAVELAAAPRTEPSRDCPVEVVVRDAAGKAVADAQVTVLLVDEAVCRLTSFKTPNPLDFFYRPRQHALTCFDLYRTLIPLADEEAVSEASLTGGDGMSDETQIRKRLNPVKARRFEVLARWQASVKTDADGKARAVIPISECTCEARVMAVAWTGNQYGASQSAMKVNRDVTVLLDGPRFLAPEDDATGVVSLYNLTDAEQKLELDLVPNAHFTLANLQRTVTLAPKASATLTYTLRANPSIGAGEVRLRVKPAQGDAYELSFELPVRPAAGMQTDTQYATLKPGESATIAARSQKEWMTNNAERTFFVCSSPLAKLDGALDYLGRYPYGCLEQTISQAFPLLTLRPADDTEREMIRKRVTYAANRVLSMQVDEGFPLWVRWDGIDQYATLYAMEFLHEVRKAGYPIDIPLFENYSLRRNLEKWTREQLNPMALYVTALCGRPETGSLFRLRDKMDTLSLDDRAILAAAFIAADNPRAAMQILKALPFPENNPTAAAWMLRSYLWLDAKDPIVPRLANQIERAVSPSTGHWGTTSSNALFVRVLAAYYNALAHPTGPVAMSFSSEALRYTSPETNTLRYAISNSLAAVTLTNAGPGTAYVATRTEAIPVAAIPPDATSGGLLLRRERTGDPAAKLVRGNTYTYRVTLDTQGATVNDLAVEIPLAAGFDLSGPVTLLDQNGETPVNAHLYHTEARDDRIIAFLSPLTGRVSLQYRVLAVSSGTFAHPPATASAMYAPDCSAVAGGGRITIARP